MLKRLNKDLFQIYTSALPNPFPNFITDKMLEAPCAPQQPHQHLAADQAAPPVPRSASAELPECPAAPGGGGAATPKKDVADPTVVCVCSATGVDVAGAEAALAATGGDRDAAILR